MILAALLMVAMITMSAIAVDVSNARQQRRQSQGTADAAALAGAQDLPDAAKVVATVKSYALTNFDIPTSDWVGCSDPDALPEHPDTANSNTCISIDEALARVRVKMPIKDVDTYFAGVIGVNSIPVSSDAIAEATLKRDDRIIPATVAAASGAGNICIENAGNNQDCALKNAGNFGSFDSRRTKIYLPSQLADADSLRINYSMGVDHALSIYGTGSPKVCDVDQKTPCTTTNIASGLDANHLIPFTGNVVPPLTDGLADNASIKTDDWATKLFCGRLRRPDLTPSNLTVTDPLGCNYWTAPAMNDGPSLTVVGEAINGRHITFWMKDEFRHIFYGTDAANPLDYGPSPLTNNSASAVWAAGDAKLECFMKSYRFDYVGSVSIGQKSQTEFFIDPTQPIDTTTGAGVQFPTANNNLAARNYLTACGLDASVVNLKVSDLSDGKNGDVFWPMFDKNPAGTPDTTMVGDPRFGMIPVVKNFSTGGSTAMQIVRFWSVYMYRLYTTSTKIQAVDAWAFEPALIATKSGIADLQFGYQTNEPKVRLVE